MIKVTHKGEARAFPNKMLQEVALELAGGGWTEKQTIVAMMICDNLIDHGVCKLHGGRTVITMTDDGETEKALDRLMEDSK